MEPGLTLWGKPYPTTSSFPHIQENNGEGPWLKAQCLPCASVGTTPGKHLHRSPGRQGELSQAQTDKWRTEMCCVSTTLVSCKEKRICRKLGEIGKTIFMSGNPSPERQIPYTFPRLILACYPEVCMPRWKGSSCFS